MSSPADLKELGRYQIVRRIAKGGMAEILLAKAQGVMGFERPVAIKLIHRHLMTCRARHELKHKGHQTAVPGGQPGGRKRQALCARRVLECLFELGDGGKVVLQAPAAGQVDQQGLCCRVAAVQFSATA